MDAPGAIERALRMVGELLEARGERFAIVIVGGAAMNLASYVSRATTEVDVLAMADPAAGEVRVVRTPDAPLPAPLLAAASAVAKDVGLAEDWLDVRVAEQWRQELPPGLPARVSWQEFGGLEVGVVDRHDLVAFKLYAAADHRGPSSVHVQDLLALRPSDAELAAARAWLVRQDVSPELHQVLDRVIAHVRARR